MEKLELPDRKTDGSVGGVNTYEEAASETGTAYPEEEGEAKRPLFRRPRRSWKRLAAGLLAAALALGIYFGLNFLKDKKTPAEQLAYSGHVVGRRDIVVTLKGTGTLLPADSYNVTALVAGEVLSADFEEGDYVERDSILYQIDTKDIEKSIESARIALERAELSQSQLYSSLEDLNVSVRAGGTVVELDLRAGDLISAGQPLGLIRESGSMKIKIPFNSADTASFYIGQQALLTIDGTFETLNAAISAIDSAEEVIEGNMLVRYVTFEAENPGGISGSTVASARVGGIASNGSGSFEYKEEKQISSPVSGKVEAVYVSEGQRVSEGQPLLKIDAESVQNQIDLNELSIKDGRLALQNTIDILDDYTIKSPISGTIVEKTVKEGDRLQSGVLCAIYDMSYLTVDLYVDELDISSIRPGQRALVTADAVRGREYEGVVTNINVKGLTTSGVTSYPVTIRIDETKGLLPGMNIDAYIVVETRSQVLAVPFAAVLREDRVLVRDEGYEPGGAAAETADSRVPPGYRYADVVLGLNDEEYIEVLEGLEEGQEIAVLDEVIDPSSAMDFMIEQSGGQMGGPQGGMRFD